MNASEAKAKAAQLKEEGNKCFVAKDYPSAHGKYTKAIDLDDTNAVLYANRGACSMSMRKYLDAAADCRKATELDPSYAKAWMRLGAANQHLASYGQSIESYEKALSVLSAENLTPADIRLKEQAESELAAVRRKAAPQNAPRHHIITRFGPDKMPWQRAERLVNERLAEYGETPQCAHSSAWLMYGAATQWNAGIQNMKNMKRVRTAQGEAGMQVMMGVLDDLSNAVLQDDRVFHIEDQNFIELYNNQVTGESGQFKAWVNEGPQQIFPAALKMQREQGWAVVRPALATTVRAYIMRGFMESGLRNRHDTGVEFIGKAIEIIRWGRKTWQFVRKEDRGVIFEDTFLIGVQNMHLEIFMKAYQQNPGLDAKYSLTELLQHAEDIVETIEKLPVPQNVDPGFTLAFYVYPKARSFAMVGYFHNQMAQLRDPSQSNEILEHRQHAATAYLTAAETYPEDDECHAWYIKCALDVMYYAAAPVGSVLGAMEDLRKSIPKMKRLWEHSALAQGGRDKALERVLEQESRLRARLRAHEVDLDTLIVDGPP
ncbi:hypothetical protein NM688_g2091 [Phlebia brevispora]|uniref:Uncharacterized protein n=1 Tax=Phlebia brevispora TaxID=194682 RepID=A0ACC1T9U6_9APHY|nr:hypothetical protein NM688_g2091 [Phlebia brevispora]